MFFIIFFVVLICHPVTYLYAALRRHEIIQVESQGEKYSLGTV
jgi:hypothetical protein